MKIRLEKTIQNNMKQLDDIFNMKPQESTQLTIVEDQTPAIVDEKNPRDVTIDSNADSDYETARQNILDLIKDGKSALDTALSIAESSEHPRAIEVVGNLLQQLADLNEQLLRLSEQRRKILNDAKAGKGTTVFKSDKTAVFIGTTKDLNKQIQEK